MNPLSGLLPAPLPSTISAKVVATNSISFGLLDKTHRWLARLSRFWLHTFTLVLVAVVFALDYVTGPPINPTLFYFVPVGLAVWYLGRRAGLGYALLCIFTWFAAERIWTNYHQYTAVIYWNTFMRLASFGLLVFLLILLKGRLSQLAARMERRTATLRESEATLQAFFDSPGLMRGIIEALPDDILHIRDNEHAAHFFHRTPAALRQQRASALGLPANIIREWLAHYQASRETGQPVNFEYDHHDGKALRHFSVTVSHLGSGDSGPRYAYAMQDITERKQAAQALQQSQALLQSVVEGTSEAIYVKDTQGRYLLFNSAAGRFTGQTAAQVLGKDDTALFPLAEVQKLMDADRRAMASPVPLTHEDILTCADGVTRTFLSTKGPIRDPQGNIIGLFGVSRDITKMKQAELTLREARSQLELRVAERTAELELANAALLEKQTLLRTAFDNAPFEFWVRDQNEVCIMENAAVARHWGSLLGKRPEEAGVSPEAVALWRANNRRAFGGEVVTGEVELHEAGGVRWIYNVVAPLKVGGEIRGIIGYNFDITERKRAEEALRLREKEVRTLVENSQDYIVRLDHAARHVYANAATARLYGLPPENFLGKNLREMGFPEEVWRPAEEACNQVLTTGREVMLEQGNPFGDSMRCFEARHVPEFAPDGSVASVLVITREVTKRKRVEEALHQANAILRAISEATNNFIGVKDRQGRYLYANPALCRLSGRPESELLAQDGLDWVANPEEAAKIRANDQRIMETGVEETVEESLNFHPDRQRYYLFTKYPYRDGEGKVIGVIGIGMDITERKEAEAALHEARDQLEERVEARTAELRAVNAALVESEEKFSVAFKNSPYAIAITRLADGFFLDANDAFSKLTGYSRAEIRHSSSLALGLWAEPADRDRASRKLLADGRLVEVEFKLRIKSGEIRTSLFAAHLIQIKNEPHILSIINDITESKRVAAVLQLQGEINRNLAEGLVLVRATDKSIVHVNLKLEQMFGYPPGELIGQPITVLHTSTGRPAAELADEIISQLERDGVWSGEVQNRRKDGTDFWCWVSISTFQHPDHGKVWLATNTDITGQKQAEAALLEISDREQARIGQDLHDGLCQHLVGTAFAASAVGQKLADRGVPEVNDVTAIAAMLDEAITQTRKIARGLFLVHIEAEGLSFALQELADSTRRRTGVVCRFECPEPVLIRDNTAATQLFRIAQEAVTNALKHARSRQIIIRLARCGLRLELTVLDDGPGLPALPPNHSGLGLNIMSYRARTIGGRLLVSRRPEGGTAVSCSLSDLSPVPENERNIS